MEWRGLSVTYNEKYTNNGTSLSNIVSKRSLRPGDARGQRTWLRGLTSPGIGPESPRRPCAGAHLTPSLPSSLAPWTESPGTGGGHARTALPVCNCIEQSDLSVNQKTGGPGLSDAPMEAGVTDTPGNAPEEGILVSSSSCSCSWGIGKPWGRKHLMLLLGPIPHPPGLSRLSKPRVSEALAPAFPSSQEGCFRGQGGRRDRLFYIVFGSSSR